MWELRLSRAYWGPRRLVFELAKRRVMPMPSESAVYRALLRAGMIDPSLRDRRSREWKRWERGSAMELWQMDKLELASRDPWTWSRAALK